MENSYLHTMDQMVTDMSPTIEVLIEEMGRMRVSMNEMSRTIADLNQTVLRKTDAIAKLHKENQSLKERLEWHGATTKDTLRPNPQR